MFEPFTDTSLEPNVRGFLHAPKKANGDALVLSHGAGANCRTTLLFAISEAFCALGFAVLRYDLPFRQERPTGPPRPGSATRDQEGIRNAIEALSKKSGGRVFAGGHSYGGRQTSMLLAQEPELAAGILLLSYPLHPPKKPEQPRTAHFPKLGTRAFFVHGTRDPFGSIEEMKAALKLIPARHELFPIDGAGHDLLGKKGESDVAAKIATAFHSFLK